MNDARLAIFINRRGWPSRGNAPRHNKLTLGDLGGAVGRLNEDIATLGTQSRGNSLGESVNTLEDAGTSFDTELELLRCGQPGLNSESFGIGGNRGQRSSESPSEGQLHRQCSTHLVGKTLLLEVQGGAGERGTLGSGREDRSPGRQGALHC